MASTYSTNLRLELIGTGEQQGSWGITTNTNLGTLLEEAIGGYVSVTVSDVTDTTLTTNNGAADQARNMVINLVGTLTAARNVIVPAAEKIYIIKNATTGGYAVTVKVTGQTGVSIPSGAVYLLYVDGTDVRAATGSMSSQNSNAVSITGGTITGITDLAVADGGTGASTAVAARANLGLGSTDAVSFKKLDLVSDTAYEPQIQMSSANNTGGSAGYVIFDKSRGTNASRTAAQSGDYLGTLLWRGFDGTDTRESASILGRLSGTVSSTSMPGNLYFNTAPNGSTTPVMRMHLDSEGRLGVGGSPSYQLDVLKDANENNVLRVWNGNAGSSATSLIALAGASGKYTNFVNSAYGSYFQLAGGGGITTAYYDMDTHAFRKNDGSEAMRISGGNVGIGTTSPSFKLDVVGTSSSVGQVIRAYNGDTSSSSYAGMQTGTGQGVALQMYSYNGAGWFGTTSNHPLLFLVNNAEQMRLTSGGDVAIGLTSASYKLDVNGGIRTQGWGSSAAGTLVFGNGASTSSIYGNASILSFFNGGSERMRLSDGYLGIGTTSPYALLEVANAGQFAVRLNNSSSGKWKSEIGFFNGTTAKWSFGIDLNNDGTNDLFWYSGGTKMSLTGADGNLTLPSGSLTAAQYVIANNTIIVDQAYRYKTYEFKHSGTRKAYITYDNTDNFINVCGEAANSFLVLSTAATERLRIDTNGNVGIGTTSPTVPLDVNGQIRSVDGTVDIRMLPLSASSAAIVGTISNHPVVVYTNNTERARFDTSGNFVITGAGGLGYGTGSGGTVTQTGTRSTGVTINKTNGSITLINATNQTTYRSFTVTNSTVAATDTVVISQKSGVNHIVIITAVAAGSFEVSFASTGTTTSDAPVFNFAVIKAVNS